MKRNLCRGTANIYRASSWGVPHWALYNVYLVRRLVLTLLASVNVRSNLPWTRFMSPNSSRRVKDTICLYEPYILRRLPPSYTTKRTNLPVVHVRDSASCGAAARPGTNHIGRSDVNNENISMTLLYFIFIKAIALLKQFYERGNPTTVVSCVWVNKPSHTFRSVHLPATVNCKAA